MGRSVQAVQGGMTGPITSTFGAGQIIFFTASTVWTIPAGITAVRSRVWGAGGLAGGAHPMHGGGGGFSMKVITGLTSGGSLTITVGTTGSGTSSVSGNNSATGGNAGSAYGAGGIGSGGDINVSGGDAYTEPPYYGGGNAGNLLGGGRSGRSGLFSAIGTQGVWASTTGIGPAGSGQSPPNSSIDLIGCGGGGGAAGAAGSYISAGSGTSGGGGGYGTASGGAGGFPGGGGGAANGTFGNGLVILEW
jgi:hypothetical protein